MPRLVPPVIAEGALRAMAQPVIEVDAELVLRPFVQSDAAAVLEAFNDPDIVRWHFRRFDVMDEARSWIAETHDGWRAEVSANWAVVARTGDRVLGRVGLYPDLRQGSTEVAYWILPAARRRAVASRAVSALTTWAHALGLHRAFIEHSTLNEGSCLVAQRCGFAAEGTLRAAHVLVDGRHDVHVHAHLATDATAI